MTAWRKAGTTQWINHKTSIEKLAEIVKTAKEAVVKAKIESEKFPKDNSDQTLGVDTPPAGTALSASCTNAYSQALKLSHGHSLGRIKT